jgi:hypothetical protein
MKPTVNIHFTSVVLDPLAGLADDDEAVLRFRSLNTENGTAVREVIRDLIVPYVSRIEPPGIDNVKLALRYCLTVGGVDFQRMFDAVLPPFDPPRDARLFFLWVWQECFPDEEYELSDPDLYQVACDVNEVTYNIHIRPTEPG